MFSAVDDDWLATATEASRLLALRDDVDLRPDRVWQWAKRGRSSRKGGTDRSPTYRLGDLIALLDTTETTVLDRSLGVVPATKAAGRLCPGS